MKGDLIETLKIITDISRYRIHFSNISPQAQNLLSRDIPKSKSIYHMDFLQRLIISNLFLKQIAKKDLKFPNRIKTSSRLENITIKFDDFRKKCLEKEFKMVLLGSTRRIT